MNIIQNPKDWMGSAEFVKNIAGLLDEETRIFIRKFFFYGR